MIQINRQPTARDVRVFALLWLLFFGLVAGVAWVKPQGLAGAATILGAAWLVSLAFNGENRKAQLAGIALPLLFAAVSAAVGAGLPRIGVVATLLGIGMAGGVAIFASYGLGRAVYVGWMTAALPIGWTISHAVLAGVYYLVLTPIGLLLRLTGRDTMQRRFDREASTYWVERPPMPEASRYFRQF